MMDEQRKVKVEIIHMYADELCGSLPDLIKFAEKKIVEHADKTNLRLDYEYEGGENVFYLKYDRPETDEEFKLRVEETTRWKENRRKEYEVLKREFGE